jgi:hypothetical protein
MTNRQSPDDDQPVSFEFVVEPLWASLLFRSAPVAGSGVVVPDGDPSRLCAVGDVRSREVRILTLRALLDEAETSRLVQLVRGL